MTYVEGRPKDARFITNISPSLCPSSFDLEKRQALLEARRIARDGAPAACQAMYGLAIDHRKPSSLIKSRTV